MAEKRHGKFGSFLRGFKVLQVYFHAFASCSVKNNPVVFNHDTPGTELFYLRRAVRDQYAVQVTKDGRKKYAN